MHSDSTKQEKREGEKEQVPRGSRDAWGSGDSGQRGAWAHSLKQWAADTSHRAPMTAAPQKCSLFSRRLTCHGNSPGDASTPPTILPAVLQPGCKPQSARQITNQDPQWAGPRPSPWYLCRWVSTPRPPRRPRLGSRSGRTLGRAVQGGPASTASGWPGEGGTARDQAGWATDHSGPRQIRRSSPLCRHTLGSLWSHTGCCHRRRRSPDSDLRAEKSPGPDLTPLPLRASSADQVSCPLAHV